MTKFIIVIVLLVVLVVGIRLLIPHLGNCVAGGIVDRNGQQSLADCPSTPNCFRDFWPALMSARQTLNTLTKVIDDQPGTRLVSRSDQYMHVTFSTPLMGYVDDVEFLYVDAIDESGSSGVQVRSASRIGHSDLGANEERVRRLQALVGRTLVE